MQLAREGRTIVGQGIRTRVVSTVRALTRTTVATVQGVMSAIMGLVSAPLGLPVAAVLSILLAVGLLVSLVGGIDSESNSGAGALDGVAAQVATALAGYGFSDEATAAVLGNMMQESGLNPGTDGGDGFANGATSLGLLQLTDHGSDHERTDFLNWCAANGKTWSDVATQIEWSFSGEPGTSPYWERWGPGLAASYYELEDGYQARFGTDFYRSGAQMKESTDVDLATYSWMACYERPGSRKTYGDDVSRLDNRLRYANDFLAQIRSGGSGQDYQASSDQQKAIVDATTRVPSPGAGLCAMWVSQVYSAAGLGYPGGNANDMYWNYCTSSDRNQLKVGMLVAVPSWTGTSAGRIYGHVGIYIGDGKVISNKGWIETETLDSFIKTYGTTYTVKWGFAGGVQAN